MAVHVALLAVPAVAGGFLQAFQFAFLLWPFNLALPLARHLPRACVALRGVADFYAAELRRYCASSARLLPPGSHRRHAAPHGGVRQRVPEDVFAHSMIALVDISY
ncbi:hypothetical protein ACP70R_010838 [Stipagrostis hirtigluma subsp. patula]